LLRRKLVRLQFTLGDKEVPFVRLTANEGAQAVEMLCPEEHDFWDLARSLLPVIVLAAAAVSFTGALWKARPEKFFYKEQYVG